MGETRSLKASPNIYSVIHGLNSFGPIISKLVHELTLNPLLLFHHVVHVPKYSLFELKTLIVDLVIPFKGKMQYSH
jgi:hypothetical protein